MRGFEIDSRSYPTHAPVAEKVLIGSVIGFNAGNKRLTAKVLRQAKNGNIEASLNKKTIVLIKTNNGWKQINL